MPKASAPATPAGSSSRRRKDGTLMFVMWTSHRIARATRAGRPFLSSSGASSGRVAPCFMLDAGRRGAWGRLKPSAHQRPLEKLAGRGEPGGERWVQTVALLEQRRRVVGEPGGSSVVFPDQ